MLPFIVREQELLTFDNLTYSESPIPAVKWWDDPDRCLWYVALLNRSLNKLTGRKGLQLDKEHHRYYFEPAKPGEDLSITYASLTLPFGQELCRGHFSRETS
jgi:hypothetical protein